MTHTVAGRMEHSVRFELVAVAVAECDSGQAGRQYQPTQVDQAANEMIAVDTASGEGKCYSCEERQMVVAVSSALTVAAAKSGGFGWKVQVLP